MKAFVIFFCLLLGAVATLECINTLVQTGTFVVPIQDTISSSRLHTYQIKIQIQGENQDFSYALGIKHIGLSVDHQVLDIMLTGKKKSDTKFIIHVMLNDINSYAQLKISYMFSYLETFYMDTVIMSPMTFEGSRMEVDSWSEKGGALMHSLISGIRTIKGRAGIQLNQFLENQFQIVGELQNVQILQVTRIFRIYLGIITLDSSLPTSQLFNGIQAFGSSDSFAVSIKDLGICQSREYVKCFENQLYDINEQACYCKQGYAKLDELQKGCNVCAPRYEIRGGQCACAFTYFTLEDGSCQPCFENCGTCSGPSNSQCLSCIDTSFKLCDGICIKREPCSSGYFLNERTSKCQLCSSYCSSCLNQQLCLRCINGFDLVEENGFQTYCEPICGDGRVNAKQQCDDSNADNGDGCSSKCEIEQTYVCFGGSSLKKSICLPYIPGELEIILKGQVQLQDSVLQSINLSFLPPCVRRESCKYCDQLFQIETEKPNNIDVEVKYIDYSSGQFLATFFYKDIPVSPIRFSVQINKFLPESVTSCLAEKDLAKFITGVIAEDAPEIIYFQQNNSP